jgi:hypothetical protein
VTYSLRTLDDHTFILDSSALEAFLFDRTVVGVPLLNAAREATTHWLGALRDNGLLAPTDDADAAGLTILTGGLYYGLQPAWQTVFGSLLPENFIGIKRHLDERNQWFADYHYVSFEAPCRTVLIGDTVASGASVSQGIRAFADWGRTHGLEQVHFFSACGSLVGGRRIRQACANLGLKVTFTHGLAAFGMAEQGWQLPDTDLPWLHPDTITQPHYRRRAELAFEGKPVCAIGDWGLRCKNPKAYLKEWHEEAAYWQLTSTSNTST